MKTAIVTAANSPFMDLLLGLVASVRSFSQLDGLDLCVLDVGLTEPDRVRLAPLVTRVAPADWDIDFPERQSAPEWIRALTARPNLPPYFPEYEILLAIDADAWFCSPQAVELLVRAAEQYGMGVVPEIDRAYALHYGKRPNVEQKVAETYAIAFGSEIAQKLVRLPIINAGVFAMRADSPNWQAWAKVLRDALQRCPRFLVEQASLNYAFYTGRITAHFLPSWCNWNCNYALPVLDPDTRMLFSPMLPHEAISVCHLTDLKRTVSRVLCTDGLWRRLPLTYEAVRVDPLPAGTES